MPPLSKNILLWIGIMVAILLLINLLQGGNISDNGKQPERLAYSDFLNKVESGEVSDVVIRESAEAGTRIQGHFNNNEMFSLQAPNDPQLVDRLRHSKVKLAAAPANTGMDNFVSIFLSSWLPRPRGARSGW